MTRTRGALAALSAVALLIWIAVAQASDGRLHVLFLDVESGQGVIVRTPSGHVLLVDGGPHASTVLSALGRYLPFWQRTIDSVIATHQGSSAVLPLLEVTERYRVLQSMGPPPGADPTAAYRKWSTALIQRHVPLVQAQAETRLDLGDGVSICVMDSSSERLALLLSYGSITVCLPGAPGLSLCDGQPSVIALPTGPDVVRPDEGISETFFVLYNGVHSRQPTAHSSRTGGRVFSTAGDGTIEMVSDGAGLTLRPVD